MPNGVLIYDINLGRITFANREMSDIVDIKSLHSSPSTIDLQTLKDGLKKYSIYENAQPSSSQQTGDDVKKEELNSTTKSSG